MFLCKFLINVLYRCLCFNVRWFHCVLSNGSPRHAGREKEKRLLVSADTPRNSCMEPSVFCCLNGLIFRLTHRGRQCVTSCWFFAELFIGDPGKPPWLNRSSSCCKARALTTTPPRFPLWKMFVLFQHILESNKSMFDDLSDLTFLFQWGNAPFSVSYLCWFCEWRRNNENNRHNRLFLIIRLLVIVVGDRCVFSLWVSSPLRCIHRRPRGGGSFDFSMQLQCDVKTCAQWQGLICGLWRGIFISKISDDKRDQAHVGHVGYCAKVWCRSNSNYFFPSIYIYQKLCRRQGHFLDLFSHDG